MRCIGGRFKFGDSVQYPTLREPVLQWDRPQQKWATSMVASSSTEYQGPTGKSLSRFLFNLLQAPTGKPVLRKSCLLHDSACDCYVFGNRRFQHRFFFSRCGATQVCFVWVDVVWVYISSKKWRCHCFLKFWVRQLSFYWRLGDRFRHDPGVWLLQNPVGHARRLFVQRSVVKVWKV